MLFAGFNVSDGRVLACSPPWPWDRWPTSWAPGSPTRVGYYGRVDILEKHGKKLHIKKSHLEWADRWFERHGDATVFFTRMLPIIRTFISLPAGVARMPFWRFSVLTLAGCIPWVLMLTFIGKQAGDNWEDWKDYAPLRRLRRGRGDRGRRGLPRRAPAPRRPPVRPGHRARLSPAPPRAAGGIRGGSAPTLARPPMSAAPRHCVGGRPDCRGDPRRPSPAPLRR